MSETADKPVTPTIWTAAAASSVPALSKLDMTRRPSGAIAAKERAAAVKAKVENALTSYVARASTQSRRKRVK
jgi:hypothetical protein